MARRPFFIGTRDKMLQTRMPSVSMPSSKVGWSSKMNYLNGGASVRKSYAASKRYELSWDSISRDEARVILDIADGVYGTGAVYFLDPFAANRNCLPQWWATPSLGLADGLPLTGAVRGVEIATPTNTINLPVKSIVYTCVPGASRSVWIPVPVGHTAHAVAWGLDGTGGNVTITPTTGASTTASPSVLVLQDASTANPVAATFAASDGYTGILVSLEGTGTVTLTGLLVQVLADGDSLNINGFISGQGNSGCTMLQPEYTPSSVAFDTVDLIAELIETEGWAQ